MSTKADVIEARRDSADVPALRLLEHEILSHRPNSAVLVDRLIDDDPDRALYYSIKGLTQLLGGRRECRVAAADSMQEAARCVRAGDVDEQSAVYGRALNAWCNGNMRLAAGILDDWTDRRPTDALAVKLCASIRFMSGDIAGILRVTRRTLPRLSVLDFGYGYVLGCHAFALEELGDYATAEAYGRRAIEHAPDDAWAVHAVAHVYEMTDRPSCGNAWLDQTRWRWESCSNFRFHLAWHNALYLVAMARLPDALAIYDRQVRAAATDDYRDMANAISMLLRLERLGLDVGARWSELAKISNDRADDPTLVFAMLNNLLALLRVRDRKGVGRIISSLRLLTRSRSDQGAVAASVGLPLAMAIAWPKSARLTPWKVQGMLDRIHLVGGSKAQRDIFLLRLIDRTAELQATGIVRQIEDFRRAIAMKPSTRASGESGILAPKSGQCPRIPVFGSAAA